MSGLPPNVPLRTEEIARLLGWSTKRTGRWLDGLAAKSPDIVVRVRGRRMVTIASLRRVCPDIAKRFATDADVKQLQEEQQEQAAELRLVASELREFRKKAWEWYSGVDRRLRKIEQSKH